MTGVPINYEWKPIQRTTCKGIGHDEAKCTKLIVRKEWRQKIQPVQGEGRKKISVTEVQKVRDF